MSEDFPLNPFRDPPWTCWWPRAAQDHFRKGFFLFGYLSQATQLHNTRNYLLFILIMITQIIVIMGQMGGRHVDLVM
jgi:hypothetical protein